ncbi:hypothetical protein TUSST3_77840 [Streptomyces sp. TUS-ST3]|uniref:hypothetical protein n=1 Tax=Streptomyces sp. TUS-ST3 TaxID=3025591 RepID=UPI00235B55CC|nr:hypothetical protein [Streptomyces sp. TUS-ST3]GLP71164.1 hypothetical protein TUSST3_77840 [Streptomyces sp. TUS-ST3]
MSAPAGLPWGLTRTVLRLHRTALIVWCVFVLASVGCLVWLTEVTADSVHATLAACRDDGPGLCGIGALRDYSEPMGWISTFMYYSFWAVAAWAGGALTGRELESGTARLAWSQSVSPARWLTAKLALPAAALVLGGAVFVAVYRWAWSAHRDLRGDSLLFNDVFADHGPLVVSYGLCALTVGALTGLLLGRPLPALAISVAVMTVLNQFLEARRPDPLPASGFWSAHLTETAVVLTAAALACAAAFRVLRHRTV